jgi:hypothetical protein
LVLLTSSKNSGQPEARGPSHGGLDNPIGSLYELMTLTWSEIDWRSEQHTAQRLLREGGGDQRQIAEFFAGFALATAGSRR